MGNTLKGSSESKSSVGDRKSRRMDARGKLTDDGCFKALQDHYNKHGTKFNISNMFDSDTDRFKKFR